MREPPSGLSSSRGRAPQGAQAIALLKAIEQAAGDGGLGSHRAGAQDGLPAAVTVSTTGKLNAIANDPKLQPNTFRIKPSEAAKVEQRYNIRLQC